MSSCCMFSCIQCICFSCVQIHQQCLFHSFYPAHSKWNTPAVPGNSNTDWTAPALHLQRWNHYWSGWKLSSLSSKELTSPSYSCVWLEISTWTHHHVLIPPIQRTTSRKLTLCFCFLCLMSELSNSLSIKLQHTGCVTKWSQLAFSCSEMQLTVTVNYSPHSNVKETKFNDTLCLFRLSLAAANITYIIMLTGQSSLEPTCCGDDWHHISENKMT